MEVITDRISDPRALMVMLHGAGDHADDFLRHGFIATLRERRIPVDVLAVQANSDLYLEKRMIARLHAEVIAPELAARSLPLWLTGISLGGMGASLYAQAYPGTVAGLLLLAPFFAVRGTIAEVTRAGGLAAWAPEKIQPDDEERALLLWLKQWTPAGGPAIRLGYGTNDRYAPASALLAARLPQEYVMTCAGGHDWPTWQALWPRLLEGLDLQSAPRQDAK
ncbi:MAG: esterase [Betaproteobacteria bacterium]|nr:esterase [Betaproteobacteria bacterium]